MAGMGTFPAGAAAILFDSNGYISTLSNDARGLLDLRDAIEVRGARLHALDPDEDVRLQRMIEACTRTEFDPERRIMVRRVTLSGRSSQLTLSFTMLTTPRDSIASDVLAPRALALITSAVDVGFTAAENAVADLLWSGFTLREIAEHRGTSHETVRTQVKAIYAKLGVQGRAQMMAIVARRDEHDTDESATAAG